VAQILTSPKTFMGAAVIDFAASAGWNSETSNAQINLVEDPATVGATHFDPANLGTAYVFTLGTLEFGGLLQQWTESKSVSRGRTFSVILNSPTAALEGSQVIMNSYQGVIPVHNVFNPFGARENFAYGGLFGNAFTNSAGYPWGVLLQDIQNLVNNNYASGAFGGPYIRLGDTDFNIDLTELSQLAGGLYWYRVSGTHASILSVIQDVCEAASADFMVQMVGGNPDSVTGLCIDPPTIKIRVMPRHSTPSLGILKAYVDTAEADGKLISKTLGQEFGETMTSKMVFGGPKSRMWENYSSEFGGTQLGTDQWGNPIVVAGDQIVPIWDIDQGTVTIGDHYRTNGRVSSRLPEGLMINASRFYNCTILELRCAMTSKEAWETFASQFNQTIYNLLQKDLQGAAAAPLSTILGTNSLKSHMQAGTATVFDASNTSSGAADQWEVGATQTIPELMDKIYNSVRRTADEYYGRQFLVAVPYEPGGFGNNVKFVSEDMDIIASWEVSGSAWVDVLPPRAILDISFYDGDGRLKPYAFYPYGSDYDYSNISDNYTILGQPIILPGGSIGGNVVVKDIGIDSEINWSFFRSGGLPYVVCTAPKVMKDDKFSKKKGLEALYKNSPLGYITGSGPHSTGFGADAFEFQISPAAIIPTAIGVAMESTRHVYGPWWNQGSRDGKTAVEHDAALRPETFGSTALMNSAGITKAFATTMNLQNSESGSVEVAELPTVSLAEKIGVDGPYLSQISVNVNTSQISTKYTFETWTLDFGKIAKYNIDRISKINKNTMRFLQEMREKSKNPSLKAPPAGGAGGMNSKSGTGLNQNRYASNTSNMMVGDVVGAGRGDPGDRVGGSGVFNNIGAQNIGTTMSQLKKDYEKKFAMTSDGMFRPFITRIEGTGVAGGGHPAGYNPSPAEGIAAVIMHGTGILPSGAYGKFSPSNNVPSGNIYPTVADLNPFFAGPGLHDIQAITRDKKLSDIGDLNTRKGGYAKAEYRGFGLRGPIIVAGWGYDVNRNPIPAGSGVGSGVGFGSMGEGKAEFKTFLPDHMRKSQKWKAGPLEMYWDDDRGVWATRWQMVECRLIESLEAPSGIQAPTSGIAHIIGSDGLDTGESIVLSNRDPALSIDIDDSTHSDHAYCIAMYIGGAWIPVYITCEVAPDDSPAGKGRMIRSPGAHLN
jgi:hypothetical protein